MHHDRPIIKPEDVPLSRFRCMGCRISGKVSLQTPCYRHCLRRHMALRFP